MKKLFLNVLFIVTVLITLQCISVVKAAESNVAAEYKIGDNVTATLYEDNTLIVTGTGEIYNYEYDIITNKGNSPFFGMKINKILIKDGVTSVGNFVFNNVKNLNEIEVAGTVKQIGEGAFQNTQVEKVVLHEGIEYIGCSAFWHDRYMNDLTLPSTIKKIDMMAFYCCESLTEIILPEQLEEIGESAFGGIVNVKEITMPKNVKKISDFLSSCGNAVDNNQYILSNIYVDADNQYFKSMDGVLYTKNGKRMLIYPMGRTDECVAVPDGVEEIGNVDRSGAVFYTFENRHIKKIILPDTITSIGEFVFQGADNLEEINLPDVLTTIGGYAFNVCKSLKHIDIPESVEQIYPKAFANCTSLTTVTIKGRTNLSVNIFDNDENLTVKYHAPNVESQLAQYAPNVKKEYMPEHNLKTLPAEKPSCTKTGRSEGSYCSACGNVIVKQEILPATGHEYIKDRIVEPTYTEHGYTVYICKICGKEKNADYVECKNLSTPVIRKCINTTNGILLNWDYIEDATGYEVYRTIDNVNWYLLSDTNDAGVTDYVDNNVFSGVVYTYAIKVYSGNYISDKYMTYSIERLTNPSLTMALNTTSGIQVKWSKVTGSTGYIVYRKTGIGSWSRVADIKSDSTVGYTDKTAKSGTTYTYTVRAYSGNTMGDWSSTKTIKRLADPTVSSASNITAGVQVKWSKVTGATGYIVYRKTGIGSWSRVADIKSGSTVSYTDKTAKSGTTYTYTVRAYSGSTMGDWSSTKTVKRLADPTVSSASNITAGVQVKWTKVTGATGYIIYRKTGTGSWSRLATIKSGSTTSYTDKSAKSGTNYSYTVRAYNGSTMSDWHNYKTVKRLSNPAVTSASKTSNGINVKWSKVTGATGYVVYRKTAKGSWSRIANIKSGSTTSYTDTKASKGVTYTYTVRAYNGSTMSSFNSTKSAKR